MSQPNFSTSNTTDADYSVNQQSSDMNGYNTGTDTGKSLSEALLFAGQGEIMLCTKIVLNVKNNFSTQHVLPRFELGIFMY